MSQLDQAKYNKIVNELLNAEDGELDEVEKETLQEQNAYLQQVSQVESQISNLEKRIETLKEQKTKMSGVAEYVLSKAVQHRAKKNVADGKPVEGPPEVGPSTKSGKTIKQIIPEQAGAENEGETGAEEVAETVSDEHAA